MKLLLVSSRLLSAPCGYAAKQHGYHCGMFYSWRTRKERRGRPASRTTLREAARPAVAGTDQMLTRLYSHTYTPCVCVCACVRLCVRACARLHTYMRARAHTHTHLNDAERLPISEKFCHKVELARARDATGHHGLLHPVHEHLPRTPVHEP